MQFLCLGCDRDVDLFCFVFVFGCLLMLFDNFRCDTDRMTVVVV